MIVLLRIIGGVEGRIDKTGRIELLAKQLAAGKRRLRLGKHGRTVEMQRRKPAGCELIPVASGDRRLSQ